MLDTGIVRDTSARQREHLILAQTIWWLLAQEDGGGRPYRIDIVDAQAAPAILHAIDVYHPDLLVLGTRGHGRLGRALLEVSRTDCCHRSIATYWSYRGLR